jgi:hypothetical protein
MQHRNVEHHGQATGLPKNSCYKQRLTPLTEWTWEETKQEFTEAHKAHDLKTSGDHGYHTANKANAANKKSAATILPLKGKANVQPVTLTKSQWIFSYCHSCRWSNDRKHDWISCTAAKPEHKTDATTWDNKDGSQYFK